MKKYGIINIAALLFGILFFVLAIRGAIDFLDIANEVFVLLKFSDGDISPGLVLSGFKMAIFQMVLACSLFLLPLILSIIGIRKKGPYAFLSKIALWQVVIGVVVMIVPIAYFFIRLFQL